MAAEKGGHPLTFDWTIFSALHKYVDQAPPGSVTLASTVTTSKTYAQIPEDRMPIWNDLITRGCLAVLPGEWNWFSGAVRRALLASHADVLITLGGGEGVEHYGSLFQARSKPVIPLDLQIGSSSNDGRGGSLRILDRVRSDPRLFFPLLAPDTVNAHLESLATRQGLTTATEIADGVIRFLRTISPPTAFYVRLLNSETSEFDAVERFFRTVVDPFVCRLDYTPVQMGRTPASKPFLNVEIFTRIHESTLVIADLTGMRPNCLVELGYALALGRQVVVSAMKGTDMPFDIQSVDQFIWDPEASDDSTLVKLRDHWRMISGRPALVEAQAGLT